MRKADPISREREASANPAPMTKKMAPDAASRRFRFSICHPAKGEDPCRRAARVASIGELARRGYDRPPALDLIGELFLQCFGGCLVFGNRSGAELGKAFDDVIVF